MILRLTAAAIAMASTAAAIAAEPGQAVYQRCAACHLSTRAGVPGSFPALTQEPAKLAQTAPGRRYLVLAISRGLTGPITSQGKVYRGIMPAQALNDIQVADVLNYLAGGAAGGKNPAAFTAAEVKGIRDKAATLSGAQVAQLRPK
ncbi:cytochrome c [Sphingobium sp. CECT 9361]|uniref:c-type cytochrome n=1 Tax=Sphingobium sp. CECT 9361 TaxID=2845384 RepID=UPI001E3D2EB9|nr:cytochrome c [Sphingobium sp. CECT 9361]CAH0357236.1 hypothetical protein SPH9361_04885 [Sphingobium sp. CECT 9361]